MGIYTGKVVDGRILVDGALLPDGISVTILVPDVVDEPIELTPDMVAELQEAIAEMERGDYITWEELREELQKPIEELQEQPEEALPR